MEAKKDLTPYKSKLMELTYDEKIIMSEWLHKQIELEMGEAVKAKGKQVSERIGSFFEKAVQTTKVAGSNLADQFKKATDKDK